MSTIKLPNTASFKGKNYDLTWESNAACSGWVANLATKILIESEEERKDFTFFNPVDVISNNDCISELLEDGSIDLFIKA